MSSTTTDRRQGVNSGAAIKVPCRVATTAAITLSGEQTIDGVAVVSDDRVLVKDQASGVDNGIYVCDTGAWTRALDADGVYDFQTGTLIKVNYGTANSGFWYLTTTGSITPGTTSLAFATASTYLAVISAYMQTMLDDTSAAQARNTLLIDAQTTVASATAPDIWTTTGHTIDYTGVATATSFAAAPYAGATKELVCASTAVFTAGTNMVIAGTSSGSNYTAAANDRILVVAKTTTQFLLYPLKASGAALVSGTPVLWQRLVQNAGLTVTMAANACTITLIEATSAGVPSTTSPVDIGFRNATVTTGDASKVSTTATKTVTISSGSTVGTVSGQASRIWVAAILVSGAIELAFYNSLSGITIKGFNEGGVISTTAEGGAGGADSAQTWYSTTARSNVPFVIIGYFESTQATAGTWATDRSAIVINPQYRPNDVVQSIPFESAAVVSGATAIPADDTVPTASEGFLMMTHPGITPTFAGNLERIFHKASYSNSSTEEMAVTLNQDGGAAIAVASNTVVTSAPEVITIEHTQVTGSTSAQSFTVRAGSPSAVTITMNGVGGTRRYGGVSNAVFSATEIFI